MKTQRGSFAVACWLLLAFGMGQAMAQDISLVAHATPSPPWTATEPVSITVTISNLGPQPGYALLDLEGMDMTGGLVDNLAWQSNTAACFVPAGCYDADVTPPLYDLLFCARTVTLAPGDSINCTFDVLAAPNAMGADIGTFFIEPRQADGSAAIGDSTANNRADVLFSYGAASPVPGPGKVAVFVLAVLAAGLGWRTVRRQRG